MAKVQKQNKATPGKSFSKAVAKLRARLTERPAMDAMWQTIWDFDLKRRDPENDDRALALVFGAILEQSIETAILSHCIQLDLKQRLWLFQGSDDSPIPFSLKIRFGFALGIFGDRARHDLGIIRHVRNLFAHANTDVTFKSTEVDEMCEQIKWIDKMTWGGIMGDKPVDARRRYIETVRHYFAFFESEGSKKKQLRYSTYEYPELYA